MPAYNFKARFADLVEKGIKRQTIRANRKDGKRPRVGERFIGYTGMRTKNCRKLAEGTITEVRHVMIDSVGICIDGQPLEEADANAIALLDGFKDAMEMRAWFMETHGAFFGGHLIRWL